MLVDLRMPPSNKFQVLEGEHGAYSIRINRQCRVCFKWQPRGEPPQAADALLVAGDPYQVEINKHYGYWVMSYATDNLPPIHPGEFLWEGIGCAGTERAQIR